MGHARAQLTTALPSCGRLHSRPFPQTLKDAAHVVGVRPPQRGVPDGVVKGNHVAKLMEMSFTLSPANAVGAPMSAASGVCLANRLPCSKLRQVMSHQAADFKGPGEARAQVVERWGSGCPAGFRHPQLVGKERTRRPRSTQRSCASSTVKVWKRTLDLEWWRFQVANKRSEISTLQLKWRESKEKQQQGQQAGPRTSTKKIVGLDGLHRAQGTGQQGDQEEPEKRGRHAQPVGGSQKAQQSSRSGLGLARRK